MQFIRNAWYQAAWADELDIDNFVARRLLDVPVLLFRDETGEACAILDRCPHRFSPLSAGTFRNGLVVCGYHGLGFNGRGKCALNPHGPAVDALSVPAFTIIERHRALWIWMGQPDKADSTAIPHLDFIDGTPVTASIKGRIPLAANYVLGLENIMDLSHTDYLHPKTLGGMMRTTKTKVSAEADGLLVEYFAENCDPPLGFQHVVPPPKKADIWIDVKWHPPAVISLNATAKPTGVAREAKDGGPSLHAMTPETATSTHYFYFSSRNFNVEDEALTLRMKAVFERAFIDEDKPMLEKQQARIGDADFLSLKPVMLPVDRAAVQVRRKLDRAAALEAEAAIELTQVGDG